MPRRSTGLVQSAPTVSLRCKTCQTNATRPTTRYFLPVPRRVERDQPEADSLDKARRSVNSEKRREREEKSQREGGGELH